jgi:hypothetical protein
METNFSGHAKRCARPRSSFHRPRLGLRRRIFRSGQFYGATPCQAYFFRVGRVTIDSRKETDRIAVRSAPCNSHVRHRVEIASSTSTPNPVPWCGRKPELSQGYPPTRSKSILDRGTDFVCARVPDNRPNNRTPRALSDAIDDLCRAVRLRKVLTDFERSEAKAEALIRQGPPFPVRSAGTKGGVL